MLFQIKGQGILNAPPEKVVAQPSDLGFLITYSVSWDSASALWSAGRAGAWGKHSNEEYAVTRNLIESGVEIVTNRCLEAVDAGSVTTSCIFTDRESTMEADWVLPLTRRELDDTLFQSLRDICAGGREDAPKSVRRIGDCEAPGLIAAAVYSGYKAAVELD